MTVIRAASTSFLMVWYCATRSSRGTVTGNPGAGRTRNLRQPRKLAEWLGWVNQSQQTLEFFICGATGNACGVVIAEMQPYSALAHPADPPSRHTHHQCEGWHVASDHRSRT